MTTRDLDENGWETSAPNWIKRTGDDGDFSRQFVLDAPMLARVALAHPQNALDVGCGEGRFCRKLGSMGVQTVGLDPIPAMIEAAQQSDPKGQYTLGFAEELPFKDESFDLIVSYLALIDIDDPAKAISEMFRVLKPNGRILVANLSSFSTSSAAIGRRYCKDTGEELRPLGRYLDVQKDWFEWDGLRIQNWHRPLSSYMQWFLEHGLVLTHFDEPQPSGGPIERVEAYQKMPYLMMMEWQKPSI
ncbi:class I SAM-dependent methyltransferase [Planktotalea sp.]|uniref:class I SAM-dependent methyltransferase n=1 Tax=Planktotalea sp. TaxID=2029877 RepID=UPI0032982DB1